MSSEVSETALTATTVENAGFAMVPSVFTRDEVNSLCDSIATAFANPGAKDSLLARGDRDPHGVRNLLDVWPRSIAIARKPALVAAIAQILGREAGIVRGLYFDKPPGNSWALPWHRDTTIAVKSIGPIGYFQKPTKKSGIPHVEAPGALLESMLTIRIHLDDVTDDNGPLRVIPGSHRDEEHRDAATLTCRAGDVLLMRPLLLHSSGHSTEGFEGHRRIVHLEFAARRELPDGYEWNWFEKLLLK